MRSYKRNDPTFILPSKGRKLYLLVLDTPYKKGSEKSEPFLFEVNVLQIINRDL